MQSTDAIVVGGGLAGLVAATELTGCGRRVLRVEQEPARSLGGQAHGSFGGLFLVGPPEQRRMGARDSPALALADWMGSAAFVRAADPWPRRWAEAYVDFAAGFGGGLHGDRALEGSFLGGCRFSGRVAGCAAETATA